MEAAILILILILLLVVIWAWRMVNWLWLTPKRLERLLREQGLEGNPYKFFVGDTKEIEKMKKEGLSKPMDLFSHDIVPRVFSFFHHSINTHGKLMVHSSIVFLQVLLCISQYLFMSYIWIALHAGRADVCCRRFISRV